MACDIHLSVSTAYGESYDMNVDYVNLPTTFGSLGILRGHSDMLCAVRAGRIRFTADNEQGSLTVSDGVATISKNQVIVLVDSIEGE